MHDDSRIWKMRIGNLVQVKRDVWLIDKGESLAKHVFSLSCLFLYYKNFKIKKLSSVGKIYIYCENILHFVLKEQELLLSYYE
jgi:hypothetical protein